MSADDQAFLDVLSSLPGDIKRYSEDVAHIVNDNVDKIAESVRYTLANSQWVPEQIRPRLPPPAPLAEASISLYDRVEGWVLRNKVLTTAIVLATGTVLYRSYTVNAYLRKTRRARRARSGGRMDVVVIAGSPNLPLTRSVALDLERKGFVVFIVSSGPEDDVSIQNLARPDIRPLGVDTTDPLSASASIERFAAYLQSPHAAVPNGKRHRLHLKAASQISFNTHLLHPIITLQAFLPLLTARLGPTPSAESSFEKPDKKKDSPKIIVCTPSIISSINPPFHAPEATVCSALSAFTEVLTAELRPLAIPVTHIQLGTFDFAGFSPASTAREHWQERNPQGLPLRALEANPQDAEALLPWPDSARHAYGKNFVSQSSSAISAGRIRGMRGSSLRELHNAVFDVIDGSITKGTVRVGLGASVYGFVGRWVPRGLVAWMMGIRKVDELAAWQSSHSSFNSPRSGGSVRSMGSENGDKDEGTGARTSNESYVAVPME
ncbi:unnamed protein product [Sordaria macrospora k-hell]|uniref:WGS project CABT00000000 data, contig 2.4 n=1 Tax=Sordaria macrospora (strain ATCC MYA-333 / DSM 997 / K(L3346) / K-hell) TaxID=771870 RepID=F7VRC7_SORMK|nr:uncharacterized protein SMAC_01626 [Sordaria macrospora k-hell]CCC08062.1 unnamed protein product [Sordaria macrospora k-hell]